jgi:3-hydroxyacyl-CoA dehydrogenase
MHFFSPANVMKLLEVVRGADRARTCWPPSMQLGKKIGSSAVVSASATASSATA